MHKMISAAALALLLLAAPAPAATLQILPGCTYGEVRTDGQYACLVMNSHIRTSFGDLPLPLDSDNVLFLRITPSGPFLLAGQSHGGRGTWLWNQQWQIAGSSFSVSPNIFGYDNTLYTATGSHQGWRYQDRVTGRLWTGDETYADPARRIGEWSTCGSVTVGQSGWSAVALYQGKRYTMERGSIVNIRQTCIGSTQAVYYIRQDDVTGFARVFDEAEIPTLFPIEIVPIEPAVEICGDRVDNDGDGEIDEAPCPPIIIIDPEPDLPTTPFCTDEPCRIFYILVAGRSASDWVAVLNQVEPQLWAKGFGQQRGTPPGGGVSGGVRGRIYWPTAKCPSAAPRPGEEPFGVRQDPACWEGQGHAADVVSNNQWVWEDRGGPAYQPLVSTQPDPTAPEIAALKKRIGELERALADEAAQLTACQAVAGTCAQDLGVMGEARDRAVVERDNVQRQLDDLKARPEPRCEAKVPAVLRRLGIRVGCQIVQP